MEAVERISGQCCGICEMPAHGVHFDIPSCRACAAFFRRSVSLGLTYRCPQKGACDVTKKFRYICRACRFKKALKFGMNPSRKFESLAKDLQVVQNVKSAGFEERGRSELSSPTASSSLSPDIPDSRRLQSDVFVSPRTACSPSRQSAIANNTDATPSSPVPTQTSPEMSIYTDQKALMEVIHGIFQKASNLLITRSFQGHSEFIANFPLSLEVSVLQQAHLAYVEIRRNRAKVQVDLTHQYDAERLVKSVYTEMVNIALFCMSMNSFANLTVDQKWVLFRRMCPRFMSMERFQVTTEILGFDPDDGRTVLYDGQLLDPKNVDLVNLKELSHMDAAEMAKLFKDSCDVSQETLIRPLKKLRPSETEIIFAMVTMLWSVEHVAEVTAETKACAAEVIERLAEEIHRYYFYEMQLPVYAFRLSRIMSAVAALDRIEEKHREDMVLSKTFSIFKHDFFFSEIFMKR